MPRDVCDFPQVRLRHPLLLLRHGETVWNREGRLQGHLDSPLTPAGRAQAREQGRVLAGLREELGAERAYCSPLGRAQETARLALGTEGGFATDPRLAEVGCGRWEGTTGAERRLSDPELAGRHAGEDFHHYVNAPGGEGLAALASRLASFLNELDGPAVIVSHKITLVTLLALVRRSPSALTTAAAPAQGTVMRLEPQSA